MGIKKVFKSTFPSINFVTRTGTTLRFIENRFETDIAREIAELEEEIKSGHPHIYIDPNEKEVDTTLQDKIKEAQAKAALEVLAEHNAATGATQSGGQEQGKSDPNVVAKVKTISPATLLGVTSSAALAGLAGPSNSN